MFGKRKEVGLKVQRRRFERKGFREEEDQRKRDQQAQKPRQKGSEEKSFRGFEKETESKAKIFIRDSFEVEAVQNNGKGSTNPTQAQNRRG